MIFSTASIISVTHCSNYPSLPKITGQLKNDARQNDTVRRCFPGVKTCLHGLAIKIPIAAKFFVLFLKGTREFL